MALKKITKLLKKDKSMNKIKYIAIAMSIAITNINAQTKSEGLGSENIIVIKAYEARIADAQKINTSPTTREVEIEKQKLSYEISEKLIDLEYPAHEVKPLAMPKIKPTTYTSSYAKLGFGVHLGNNKKVYYSPLAEVVYNNDKIKNLIFGGHYKHFSSWAGKTANQKFRNEDARFYTQYYMKEVEMGVSAYFTQNEDYYYGYPSDTIRNSKQIRQTVSNFGGDLYFKNAAINKLELDFNQKIGFNFLTDAYKNKEWNLNYDGLITKTFKNLHILDVNLGTNISNYIPSDKDDLEREIVTVGGAYTFNDDNWKLKAGITFGIGEVGLGKQFDFYPIIYTEKRLYKHMLIFYSSWRRDMQINSYQSLIAENPYINIDQKLQNSRVEDRIAGFKGTVKNLTYNARFSNKVVKDMPLFVNDTLNMSRFNVVYEKVLYVYNINAEVGFNWTDNFRTQLTFDYRIFEPTFEEKAWHLPALSTNLSASYKIKNQYFIDLEFYALAGAWARNELGVAQKIKGTADLNLGFSYKYSKNLSMFVKFNNLAHSKQTRFYNYSNYGFNGLIGAKFEF